MEIRHLKLVEAVAEEGSLTKAAYKLFLTQSALSHQLKEIEEGFGATLFHRINKKMVLTPIGKRVLKSAKVILCEIRKTESDVKKYVSGENGVLRISTECYTCYHWLPYILLCYNKCYPDVEVRIIAEATRRPIQFLLEGKLDLAIISLQQCEQIEINNISVEPLITDELVVVMPDAHKLSSRSFITAKDFSDENLIVYTAPIELLDVFQRVLIPSGVTPKKTIRIQLTEAIIEMVKAGLGITVMARWAVKPYLKTNQLHTLPLTRKGLKRTWYVATVKEENPPRYLQTFIDQLSKHTF